MESPLCVAIERPSELRTAMMLSSYDGINGRVRRGNETAEDVILGKERNEPALAENQDWRAIKRLVAQRRQHGATSAAHGASTETYLPSAASRSAAS